VADLVFPETLPKPLVAGHGFTPLPNARERDRDAGERRMRPKYRTVPESCSVAWMLTQAEFDILHEFYESDLAGGTLDFDIQLQARGTESGLTWFECRFVGDYGFEDVMTADGLMYRVSATLLAVDEIGEDRSS
jgi:hypothetical protein